MSRMLFESALHKAVYPQTCGSSGMVDRYVSRRLLNMYTWQPVMFLISLGRVQKSCCRPSVCDMELRKLLNSRIGMSNMAVINE